MILSNSFYVLIIFLFNLIALNYFDKKTKLLSILALNYIFYLINDYQFFIHVVLFVNINYFLINKLATTVDQLKRSFLFATSLVLLLAHFILFKVFYQFYGSALYPLGLSYYSFQMIGLLIDLFFNKQKDKLSQLEFNASVLFFATIEAGPIIKTGQIVQQLKIKHKLTLEIVESSILLIAFGLFKKTVGDQLGTIILSQRQTSISYSSLNSFMTIVALHAQFYADFSGYSDIARGLAGALGVQIPFNFKLPFLAENISEQWRRWHISLGEWFKEYFLIGFMSTQYFSLKNKIPKLNPKIYLGISLLVTFTLIGLWHGLSANFLIWGLMNGLLIIVYEFLKGKKLLLIKYKVFNILITFIMCCYLNALFLYPTLSENIKFMLSSLSWNATDFNFDLLYTLFFVFFSIFLIHTIDYYFIKNSLKIKNRILYFSTLFIFFCYIFTFRGAGQSFLYSQF